MVPKKKAQGLRGLSKNPKRALQPTRIRRSGISSSKIAGSRNASSVGSLTAANAADRPPREASIIQVELATPLRRVPARAKSPSPFRFKTSAGRHIPGLHDILTRHALFAAQASFHGRHPRQRRRRTQPEKDHFSRFVDLHFPVDADIAEILRALRAVPQVRQAVKVSKTIPAAVLDPLVGRNDQLGTDPDSGYELQWYIYRCGADRAWNKVSGKGVVIADVDSGFFLDHQDLVANVEREHAYNAVDGTTDVTAPPDTNHGTGVLGILGGAANGVGMAGFAFNAKLWPIQSDVGNGPSVTSSPVANAIDWVVGEDSGTRRVVINVEVQTENGGNCEQWPAVNAAIQHAIQKGFVVCVAAGNGDRDASLTDDGTTFPSTGSILVGATGYDDTENPRAIGGVGASNWGTSVIISAPGDQQHDISCDDSGTDTYRSLGGTSGAVAKVAGTVALMLEANPGLTHAQIRSILLSTGSPLDTDKPIGVLLNADAAVSAALASRTN